MGTASERFAAFLDIHTYMPRRRECPGRYRKELSGLWIAISRYVSPSRAESRTAALQWDGKLCTMAPFTTKRRSPHLWNFSRRVALDRRCLPGHVLCDDRQRGLSIRRDVRDASRLHDLFRRTASSSS